MALILSKISEFLWGIPLIVLILGCGIFLTIKLKGIQIKKTWTCFEVHDKK